VYFSYSSKTGFRDEGLAAVGEIDDPVVVVVGLDERGRHRQRVVEISERLERQASLLASGWKPLMRRGFDQLEY